jgi:hypothetical protein
LTIAKLDSIFGLEFSISSPCFINSMRHRRLFKHIHIQQIIKPWIVGFVCNLYVLNLAFKLLWNVFHIEGF